MLTEQPSQQEPKWSQPAYECGPVEISDLETLMDGSENNILPTGGDRQDSEAAGRAEQIRQQDVPISDQKRIRLAQLVTDQSMHYASLAEPWTLHLRNSRGGSRSTTDDPIFTAISTLFTSSERCTLADCAELGATTIRSSNSRSTFSSLSRDQGSSISKSDSSLTGSALHLAAPDFRVKRGETVLDILPTALDFWEELSLSPRLGAKDVSAFCICPDLDNWKRGAISFLENVSYTYQSLRLGSFELGHHAAREFQSGIVLYPLSSAPSDMAEPEVEEVCVRFGKSLQALADSQRSIVVHVTGPFDARSQLLSLCSMFVKVFETYAAGLKSVPPPSDLVLQAVPPNWIVSSHTVPTQPPSRYAVMANIVYDRCPVQAKESIPPPSRYLSGSLFELSPKVPNNLDLRPNAAGASGLLEHSSIVHIGYAWQVGMHWLSCAIIDDLGCHQWAASFYIGPSSKPWTIFRAIVMEIWDVTLELMGSGRNSFTVFVAKGFRMHDNEAKSKFTPSYRDRS